MNFLIYIFLLGNWSEEISGNLIEQLGSLMNLLQGSSFRYTLFPERFVLREQNKSRVETLMLFDY